MAVLIPLYNHGQTIRSVVERALQWTSFVFVVDDGSTDDGIERLSGCAVRILHCPHRGKGAAILAGARLAQRLGASHIITLDADGQHYPEDIPLFMHTIAEDPSAFVVGSRDFSVAHVPTSSRFGRAFSTFWMRVQTGLSVDDMQSGFRCYPLEALRTLSLTEQGYAFEIEVLVRAAWAGYGIRTIPVRVFYPPQAERVSHFHCLRDNWVISLLNTRLTIRAMLPIPFRGHAASSEALSLTKPLATLKRLRRDVEPITLAKSTAWALCLATLPFFGLQTLLVLLAIGWFSLHRVTALLVLPLTWPPFVPGLAILLGFRLRHGTWLTEFSLTTLGYQIGERLLDWIVGSFVLAPILALAGGLFVFLCARLCKQ
ncbi:MAG: DUF2062 domain-containing protein [Desulfovibrio sp.]|nr:DUF2062 domain-containing protein [Desulfovibrio sp.]